MAFTIKQFITKTAVASHKALKAISQQLFTDPKSAESYWKSVNFTESRAD